MLAYRAVAKEAYSKRKQAESLPDPEKIREIHGIKETLELSNEGLVLQAASLRGAEEVESFKSRLDKYLLGENWNRLFTEAILFPETPTIAASFTFQPFHDLEGSKLQNFEDLEENMDHLVITVIPTETGGAAIFSWLDVAGPAPKRFFDSVKKSPDLTAAVIHAVADNGENVAFDAAWYESLESKNKEYICSRVRLFNASDDYENFGRPEKRAPMLSDWGEGVCSSF